MFIIHNKEIDVLYNFMKKITHASNVPVAFIQYIQCLSILLFSTITHKLR